MAILFSKMLAAFKRRALLDLETPNGRRLRDCSADDCDAIGDWPGTLSSRIRRGWMGRADRTGRRTVGDVYLEALLDILFYYHFRREIELAKVRDAVEPGDEYNDGSVPKKKFPKKY